MTPEASDQGERKRAANAPALDVCPSCGNHSDADTYCSRCGADLHVDLVLSAWRGDARSQYQAARDLAGLKLPGLSFTYLKQALAGPQGSVVGQGLTRSAARQAIAALARHGGVVTVRPATVQTQAPKASKSWVPLAAGGAVLVLAVVGLLLAFGDGSGQDPRHASAAPGPTVVAAAAPGDPNGAEVVTPAPVEPALTTEQITDRVMGAIATVICKQSLGTAFFVEPDRAVTNAHVACEQGEQVVVKLADDRELPGLVAVREPRHDMAVIDVPGANVEPLALGDSTALAIGQPVVFIGNPQGLTATVHEGRVSFLGRNLHGTAFIQVNGDVNPGNSGGPLLDMQARAVGIISLKARADRIGFALPLEYLEPYLGAMSLSAEARARWQAIVGRIDEMDQQEVDKHRAMYAKPTLIQVAPLDRERLLGFVLQRWQHVPDAEQLTVDFNTKGLALCIVEGRVTDWTRAEESIRKAQLKMPDNPRLAWAIDRKIVEDLYVGVMELRIRHCSKESTTAEAELEIQGGGKPDEPVLFPRAELDKPPHFRQRRPPPSGWNAGRRKPIPTY